MKQKSNRSREKKEQMERKCKKRRERGMKAEDEENTRMG